jgi:thiol-disulfide isomerase/thioredoxin
MRPGRREALVLGGVALGAAAAGGIFGVLALQSRSGAPDLLTAGFADLEGRTRRVAEWQGNALLCNFWATWCAPCREELPLFDDALRSYSARGLRIVAIAVDNAANVQEFLLKVPLTYPILLGGMHAIDLMRRLGNPGGGLPFSVLLNRHGGLQARKLGAYSPEELRKELEALLR